MSTSSGAWPCYLHDMVIEGCWFALVVFVELWKDECWKTVSVKSYLHDGGGWDTAAWILYKDNRWSLAHCNFDLKTLSRMAPEGRRFSIRFITKARLLDGIHWLSLPEWQKCRDAGFCCLGYRPAWPQNTAVRGRDKLKISTKLLKIRAAKLHPSPDTRRMEPSKHGAGHCRFPTFTRNFSFWYQGNFSVGCFRYSCFWAQILKGISESKSILKYYLTATGTYLFLLSCVPPVHLLAWCS